MRTFCLLLAKLSHLQVNFINPTEMPLRMRVVYDCPAMLGPRIVVAPAGPGAEASLETFFVPMVEGLHEGVLKLISKEVRHTGYTR